MSGKQEPISSTPVSDLYIIPQWGSKPSPMLAAMAKAAREARQRGETPIFFSQAKGSQQNPEGETK
jgi:hypothetical protein